MSHRRDLRSVSVDLRAQLAGEPKTFRHPRVGTITLTYEVLHIGADQRISICQAAPGSPDREALDLLAPRQPDTGS